MIKLQINQRVYWAGGPQKGAVVRYLLQDGSLALLVDDDHEVYTVKAVDLSLMPVQSAATDCEDTGGL